MPTTAPQISLDHIILLLPASTLSSLPGSLTAAFTLYPGGTHADGKTRNTLILLQSGVYIELIAFVDDDADGGGAGRQGHWGGAKVPGTVVDWCLTSGEGGDVDGVRERLASSGSEVGYEDLVKGGRRRVD